MRDTLIRLSLGVALLMLALPACVSCPEIGCAEYTTLTLSTPQPADGVYTLEVTTPAQTYNCVVTMVDGSVNLGGRESDGCFRFEFVTVREQIAAEGEQACPSTDPNQIDCAGPSRVTFNAITMESIHSTLQVSLMRDEELLVETQQIALTMNTTEAPVNNESECNLDCDSAQGMLEIVE